MYMKGVLKRSEREGDHLRVGKESRMRLGKGIPEVREGDPRGKGRESPEVREGDPPEVRESP